MVYFALSYTDAGITPTTMITSSIYYLVILLFTSFVEMNIMILESSIP